MVFKYINICQVPWKALQTAAFGLGFQHLPRDLANDNAWKTMFDPYIVKGLVQFCTIMVRNLGQTRNESVFRVNAVL